VNATFAAMCSLSQNKPGDLLLWFAMSPLHRADFCSFTENVQMETGETAEINEVNALQKMGVLMLTYIFHGSLAQLDTIAPQIPKFALEATGLKADSFTPDNVSCTKAFLRAKFPGLIAALHTESIQFSSTLKSRMKLGIAGNRLLSICKKLHARSNQITSTSDVIRVLFNPVVYNSAPYFSLHPDHPSNPMKDHSKRIYAEVGASARNAGIDLGAVAIANPSLMKSFVIDSMSASIADLTEVIPSIETLVAALCGEFSITTVLA
jgi:hypothetical protein